MTSLYFPYDQHSWTTREIDPDDSWDNGDTDGTYSVTGVRLSGGMYDHLDTVEEIVAGDEVYVVWVVYGTGCTFGSQGGNGHIVACTKDEALAIGAEEWVDGGRWPVGLGAEPYKRSKDCHCFRRSYGLDGHVLVVLQEAVRLAEEQVIGSMADERVRSWSELSRENQLLRSRLKSLRDRAASFVEAADALE